VRSLNFTVNLLELQFVDKSLPNIHSINVCLGGFGLPINGLTVFIHRQSQILPEFVDKFEGLFCVMTTFELLTSPSWPQVSPSYSLTQEGQLVQGRDGVSPAAVVARPSVVVVVIVVE